jgi:aspartate 1-decarboxylase
VIIISYVGLPDSEARTYEPRVVFVDAANKPVDLHADLAAPGLLPA